SGLPIRRLRIERRGGLEGGARLAGRGNALILRKRIEIADPVARRDPVSTDRAADVGVLRTEMRGRGRADGELQSRAHPSRTPAGVQRVNGVRRGREEASVVECVAVFDGTDEQWRHRNRLDTRL